MKWVHPARGKLILFAGDSAIALLAPCLATVVRMGGPLAFPGPHMSAALVFALVFLSAFYIFDLYNQHRLARPDGMLARVGGACVTAVLAAAALIYFLPSYRYGRGIVLLATVLVGVFEFAWRWLYKKYRGAFLSLIPTLVLGTGPEADRIRQLLDKSSSPFLLKGFIRVRAEGAGCAVPEAQVLGELTTAEQLLRTGQAECLVVCDGLGQDQAGALTRLKFEGFRVWEGPLFCMQVGEELPAEFLQDSWQCFTGGFDLLHSQFARKIKRLTDLLLAAAGLVLTLPLSLIAALAIKLDSAGPVLLRQRRVGWREQGFDLLKFRSMRVDAEADGSARWASPNDPRITRVGRLLRKLHIDEIPQMVNVLRGEMSFIGPRPERPEFVGQLTKAIPFYQLRHHIPPGITGWAQVKYPYGASLEDAKRKLEFDLYYTLKASPLLDFRILLKTARIVLFPATTGASPAAAFESAARGPIRRAPMAGGAGHIVAAGSSGDTLLRSSSSSLIALARAIQREDAATSLRRADVEEAEICPAKLPQVLYSEPAPP